MAKSFAGTFLYNKYPNYEKQMIDFVMNGERLDVSAPEFEDIISDVKKRQISSALLSVLKSKNIILVTGKPVSMQHKVITCRDIKYDRDPKSAPKTFIGVHDIIEIGESGMYKCSNPDVLIARLVAAMTSTIYYLDTRRVTEATAIYMTGAEAFAKLFCHVLEYLHKISTIPGLKDRAMYMCAKYYLVNIMERSVESSDYIARKISGLSEREAEIVEMIIDKDTYSNIKFFVDGLEKVLKVGNLTVDMVVEKWMYLYGTSTVFALELFPSFAQMLTDAYVGAYINNQKTIEKVAGREMVDFTKAILGIGGRSV